MVSRYSILLLTMLILSKSRLTESFGFAEIIGSVQTISNFANDAVGILNGDIPISALLTGSTGPMLDKILDSVGDISGKIDDLSASFTTELRASDVKNGKRFDAIEAALEQATIIIPMEGKFNEDMREFRSYITRVNSLYREFAYYSANRTHFNERTINYFIEAVISRNRGDLFDILQHLYNLVVQEDWLFSKGIMHTFAQKIRITQASDPDKLCGTKISPQMQLYKMYETIFVTETRGFIMELFAFSINTELDLAKTLMLERSEGFFQVTRSQMDGLSRVIELCRASKYASGVNYIELEDFSSSLKFREKCSISLVEQKAAVDENMVVTGVRFIKDSAGLISYQIKEAKLLQQGQVAKNGTWKELSAIETPIQYVNFSPISASARVFMDDVNLEPDYVVAGVDMEIDKNFVGGRMHLRLYGMKFDFETGKLEPNSGQWVSNPSVVDRKTESEWFEKHLSSRGVRALPTMSGIKNDPNNNDYAFKRAVTNTGHRHLIPLFDTRPVEEDTPTLALTGVGLYHRNVGSDGFLNYRLINIDMSKYMKQRDDV